MHPVPGVQYGRYTARLKEGRVWTCRIHPDGPEYDYDDPEREIEFDFAPYGCTCETSARWKGTGVWKYVMESIFSRILRDLYMPSIIETLNTDSILLRELTKGTP